MIKTQIASTKRRLMWHLLAGELAEHRGDVAGVLSHLLLDGLLHSRGNAT